MRKGPDKEERESKQFLEEFQERYSQLSSWQRVQLDLYIRWIAFQRRWGKLIWDWLIFQWKIDEERKVYSK